MIRVLVAGVAEQFFSINLRQLTISLLLNILPVRRSSRRARDRDDENIHNNQPANAASNIVAEDEDLHGVVSDDASVVGEDEDDAGVVGEDEDDAGVVDEGDADVVGEDEDAVGVVRWTRTRTSSAPRADGILGKLPPGAGVCERFF